jgi:hypothetical protein
MKEKPENNFEEKAEQILTPRDIRLVFEGLLKLEKYETVRQSSDEQGLYLWDVKILEKDGHREYSYMRKGRYKEGQASNTAIHLAFYDKDDFPISGHRVAKFIEGEWKITL